MATVAAVAIMALSVSGMAVQAPTLAQKATQSSFQRAIDLCQRKLAGGCTTSLHEVPNLLAQVFASDHEQTLARTERSVTNTTCLCPKSGVDGQGLLDEDLVAVQAFQTDRGARQCAGGGCSDACSRVTVASFASRAECEALVGGIEAHTPPTMAHEEFTLDLEELCATADVATTLTFLRLIERLRRLVAHEYGVARECIFIESAFTSRIPADAPQAAYGKLHADESSDESFHYSGVLHLRSAGDGFEGGDFAFSDAPAAEAARGEDGGAGMGSGDPLTDRALTRVSPLQGRAVLFSSGWENLHLVEPVTSGVRYAMPVFFRTAPDVDGAELEQHGDDQVAHMCQWLAHVWSDPATLAELQQEQHESHSQTR